jgi:hypothetical protein
MILLLAAKKKSAPATSRDARNLYLTRAWLVA